MRLATSFTLIFVLAFFAYETEAWKWSDVLPWNWAIFNRSSSKNSTTPAVPMPKVATATDQLLVEPVPGSEPKARSLVTPKDTVNKTVMPKDASKVNRELIYEYDGYE